MAEEEENDWNLSFGGIPEQQRTFIKQALLGKNFLGIECTGLQ
jgi:hypothetical protein